MAHTWLTQKRITFIYLFFASLLGYTAAQSCTIPKYIKGDWFAMIGGDSVTFLVDDNNWNNMRCWDSYAHPKPVEGTAGQNHTFLLKKEDCWHCLDVLWRTANVLQYKLGKCQTGQTVQLNDCEALKPNNVLPTVNEIITVFRQTDTVYVNCISTFEGVFQFTYEVDSGGGGICDNPNSIIMACQDPGSSYIDNQVFRMTYAMCRDCLGTWYAMKGQDKQGRGGTGYTYAAIEDTVEKDTREKFKCLMTNRNQKEAFNKVRWTMSRFAQCTYLEMTPATNYLTPQCSLPRNLTGTWITQGVQYMSNIKINDTHIYYNTRINEFEYQETFFSCQHEVDFVCFDLVRRRHSIVRYRVGKPYQYLTSGGDKDQSTFLRETFRDACSWTAFTFDRDEYEWNYETMILDPPSAVPCPIAGRYKFGQRALSIQEEYRTRIRGVTEKPRVKVPCRNWVTELKSCSNTMTRIEIDAEYCESVDYRGRPIGEYDEPDNYLMCVGYWMEDMKSYLVTWDEEDAISSYRCWIATDYQIPGTGLFLDLTENERLFDDCPQRFDPGSDEHKKPITLWVLSGATPVFPSFLTLLISIPYSFTTWKSIYGDFWVSTDPLFQLLP
ncbi:hypothetical protein MAR_037272, partial [Mya arenaria]